MKTRLHQVARPLLLSPPTPCQASSNDDGVLYHQLSDYPPRMRSVAASYWGLRDVKTLLFTGTKGAMKICAAPLVLAYENEAGAYSDGTSIFVTPSLLDNADDLSLSLIIAHELGHIVLGHINQSPSEDLENEADRFAVFTLALAEMDYLGAILKDVASRQPHPTVTSNTADQSDRAARLRIYASEVDELKAAGKPLNLNFTK